MVLTSAAIFIWTCLLLLVGYHLPKLKFLSKGRLVAWAYAGATTLFSAVVSSNLLPLPRMIIIVVLQLVSMKVLVVAESAFLKQRLNSLQWISFSLGWFGMRMNLFERLPGEPLPFAKIVWKGMASVLVGVILLFFSLILEKCFQLDKIFLSQLFMLAGLSMMLHFGVLNLCTAFWRSQGVHVSELFQAPYKATSLNEFWGKRWNVAFSEMTALIVYRPLKSEVGRDKALVTSFLFSGVLHEVAISLPVMAGFGLPMLYFVLHAIAMHFEAHSTWLKKFLQRKWFAHVWVMSFLILPLPLLFHPAFVEEVLTPLRSIILQVFLAGVTSR